MKKLTAIFMACVVSMLFACSKGSFQNDARAMYNDIITVTEKTADALDKATSAKDAGDALSAYADDMKKFVERGKELQSKYGKKDINNEPDLKPEEEKMRKAMESFTMAISKVMMKWPAAPELMAATKKMMSIGGEKAE